MDSKELGLGIYSPPFQALCMANSLYPGNVRKNISLVPDPARGKIEDKTMAILWLTSHTCFQNVIWMRDRSPEIKSHFRKLAAHRFDVVHFHIYIQLLSKQRLWRAHRSSRTQRAEADDCSLDLWSNVAWWGKGHCSLPWIYAKLLYNPINNKNSAQPHDQHSLLYYYHLIIELLEPLFG